MLTEAINRGFSPFQVSRYLSDIIDRALAYLGGFKIIPEMEEPSSIELSEYQQVQPHYTSITDILDDVNRAFADLKYPQFMVNVDQHDAKMMHEAGPMVLPSDFFLEASKIEMLPAIIFTHTKAYETDNKMINPSMFFATKLSKEKGHTDRRNIDCSHLPGSVYQCGMVYPHQKTAYWQSLYCSIVDGQVVVPIRLPILKRVKIKTKKDGFISVNQKIWGIQPFIQDRMRDNAATEIQVKECMEKLINLHFTVWQKREEFWRVSARRYGKRATFLIKESDPKKLFKDRDATIRTPSGQKKRIIHYVASHTRIKAGKEVVVKGHIRGLRQFIWNGTSCAVIAPNFHQFNSDTFTDSGVISNEKKGYIIGSKVWKMLSKVEDTQNATALQRLAD